MIALLYLLSPAAALSAYNGPAPCQGAIYDRHSPCQPSAEERLRVVEAIKEALRQRDDLADLRKEELKRLERAENGTFEDREAWSGVAAELQAALHDVDVYFAAAIHLAEQTYGVAPKHSGEDVFDGPFAGQSPPWNARVWDETGKIYRVDRPGQSDSYYYLNGTPGGGLSINKENGDVFVTLDVLQRAADSKDPTELALTLEHAGVNFDALVTKGWQSRGGAQSRAYAVEREAAIAIGADKGTLGVLLKKWQANGLDGWRTGQPQPYITAQESAKNYNEWRDSVAGRREALQKRLDDEHAQRAAEAERQHEAARRRSNEAYSRLEYLARGFCTSGYFITDDTISQWRDALEEVSVAEMAIPDWEQTPGTLPCERYLLQLALGNKQRHFVINDWQGWLATEVPEGRRRETEAWPRNLPRAAPIPQPAPAPSQPAPPGPVPSQPDPPERPSRPAPPGSEPCWGTTCGPLKP